MNRPLEGIRVLDLTQAYSGPFCTMNLADHGAEVIKIERPGSGDQTRGWGPMKNDYSGYYAYINRNKKGITLNLASEEGKKIFRELVKTADVVCENYKVGVLEKLGFSYDVLKEINPRIIYGSISGFGLEGPLASRPCYDIVAQAMSGMMSVTGFADGPPCKIGPSIADNYSGAYLCMGILMALYEREKTGVGRRLDVAMVDTLFSVMENFVVEYTIAGETPHRAGNQDRSLLYMTILAILVPYWTSLALTVLTACLWISGYLLISWMRRNVVSPISRTRHWTCVWMPQSLSALMM